MFWRQGRGGCSGGSGATSPGVVVGARAIREATRTRGEKAAESSLFRPPTQMIQTPSVGCGLLGPEEALSSRVHPSGQQMPSNAVSDANRIATMTAANLRTLAIIITRRTLLSSDGFEGIKIVGSRFSPDAHRLRGGRPFS
jgi:hypothetical protein